MSRFFIGLGIVCACGLAAHAGELTNAAAVIEFAAQRGLSNESFTADFTQSVQQPGNRSQSTGVFQFKKPMQTRLALNHVVMGRTQLVHAVMGNDRVVWQELDGGNNVLKMDLNTIPTGHPAAALLQNPFETIDPQRFVARLQSDYAETLTGTVTLHGQPMYVLEGTPRAAATRVRGQGKHRVAIGQRDGFLHRVEQFDTTGTNVVMTLEFTTLQLNAELPDQLFQYRPIANANIIDMTAVLLHQMGTTPSRK